MFTAQYKCHPLGLNPRDVGVLVESRNDTRLFAFTIGSGPSDPARTPECFRCSRDTQHTTLLVSSHACANVVVAVAISLQISSETMEPDDAEHEKHVAHDPGPSMGSAASDAVKVKELEDEVKFLAEKANNACTSHATALVAQERLRRPRSVTDPLHSATFRRLRKRDTRPPSPATAATASQWCRGKQRR